MRAVVARCVHSLCACFTSIEVLYLLLLCAAMHVNEYVSQLSSPLQLSWTEAGARLQGIIMANKKSRVKIELREHKKKYLKIERG